MWGKEKFYRIFLSKKNILVLLSILFYLFFTSFSHANFQEKLLNKYKTVNTLSFDFTQKIGKKVETGNCYIKYPLLMRCEYLKKKKSIITNGKRIAIVKRRYKKIYYYPLKKTPLFYLLNKENILNVIQNHLPEVTNSNIVEYKLKDINDNKLNIFFNKNSLNLAGWKTLDAYSNEVSFIMSNVKTNIFVENKIFKIPREEDL
tara:strand:- start:845 stop:1453 length:609 start_codon:yes stop_codon:yes gene_type:complete